MFKGSDVEVQEATDTDNTNAGSKYNWRFTCTCHLSLRTLRLSVRWYLLKRSIITVIYVFLLYKASQKYSLYVVKHSYIWMDNSSWTDNIVVKNTSFHTYSCQPSQEIGEERKQSENKCNVLWENDKLVFIFIRDPVSLSELLIVSVHCSRHAIRLCRSLVSHVISEIWE